MHKLISIPFISLEPVYKKRRYDQDHSALDRPPFFLQLCLYKHPIFDAPHFLKRYEDILSGLLDDFPRFISSQALPPSLSLLDTSPLPPSLCDSSPKSLLEFWQTLERITPSLFLNRSLSRDTLILNHTFSSLLSTLKSDPHFYVFNTFSQFATTHPHLKKAVSALLQTTATYHDLFSEFKDLIVAHHDSLDAYYRTSIYRLKCHLYYHYISPSLHSTSAPSAVFYVSTLKNPEIQIIAPSHFIEAVGVLNNPLTRPLYQNPDFPQCILFPNWIETHDLKQMVGLICRGRSHFQSIALLSRFFLTAGWLELNKHYIDQLVENLQDQMTPPLARGILLAPHFPDSLTRFSTLYFLSYVLIRLGLPKTQLPAPYQRSELLTLYDTYGNISPLSTLPPPPSPSLSEHDLSFYMSLIHNGKLIKRRPQDRHTPDFCRAALYHHINHVSHCNTAIILDPEFLNSLSPYACHIFTPLLSQSPPSLSNSHLFFVRSFIALYLQNNFY